VVVSRQIQSQHWLDVGGQKKGETRGGQGKVA
jgi:hypothetical protein